MADSERSELRELAKQAVEVCGSIEEAVQWVRDAIDGEKGQRRKALVAECVKRATSDAVYDVRHEHRIKAKASPGNARSHHGPGTYAEITATMCADMLESWSTDLGKKLGDATGIELGELAQKEHALARGHRNNATFYERLAKLAGDAVVREKVSGDQVRQLWDEVSGNAG